ncbi:hypothetical protein HT136_24090 [Novosphingobium profundi]|uniref:hypothetical protein n=1 Tax=Novosphingobium profundi TaxID=1774954 RepID=UPI001BD969E3|nr:hypothetical protein [Novosphingobium profundi]MBT0671456.1 hypothetical protein [Novosphingobium profundi]
MNALRPEAFEDAQDLSGPSENARTQLHAIACDLDGHFDRAGATLGQTVETIDIILASLQEVAQVFEHGEAASSVATLTRAATRLSQVATSVTERASDIARIGDVSRRLYRHIDEVQRCLRVLDIYAMNVKIAASGATAFVEFADQMSRKLKAGTAETEGFAQTLLTLDQSLSRMQAIDALLLCECRKIIPHVPDRLLRDADALRAHQDALAELAQTTGNLARSIQTELASALSAIQVGDRARQRLEHAVAGCDLMAVHLSGATLDQPSGRDHAERLLAALVEETALEYRRDATALLSAIGRLGSSAHGLSALQEHGGDTTSDDVEADDASALFLRRMEDDIAQAAAMIAQLHRADAQAEETLEVIVTTLTEVTQRVAAIRNVRIDVRQMAINIGLRCRKVEIIGRPVSIIANEIRSHSDKLDTLIAAINAAEGELITICEGMRAQSNDGDKIAGNELDRALETIRDCAQTTDMALATVEQGSIGMLDLLEQTASSLGSALERAPEIAEVARNLVPTTPHSMPSDEHEGLCAFLLAMANTYTMADERLIHDRFRLPGMPAIAAPSRGALDDDDDVFDDGLF